VHQLCVREARGNSERLARGGLLSWSDWHSRVQGFGCPQLPPGRRLASISDACCAHRSLPSITTLADRPQASTVHGWRMGLVMTSRRQSGQRARASPASRARPLETVRASSRPVHSRCGRASHPARAWRSIGGRCWRGHRSNRKALRQRGVDGR